MLMIKKNSTKIIILTLCISFIFLYPYLAGFLFIDNFQPCNVLAYHDCTVYSAAVRDVYDGNFFVEDIYITENKEVNISTMPFLNPWFYAIFLFLLAPLMGVMEALIIAKLFFVVLLFILLNRLGRLVFKNKLYSLLFALLVTTDLTLRSLAIVVLRVLSHIIPNFVSFFMGFFNKSMNTLVIRFPLIFDRFYRPNLTLPILILALICLLKILKNPSTCWKTLFFYSISWSLLIYTYLFNFVPFYIGVAFLTVFYFFKNQKISKNLFITTSFSLILSVPYWINHFRFLKSSFYADYIYRIGVETGHFIRYLDEYWFWLITLILFILIKTRIDKEWFYACLALFFGALIGLNLQVLTGFNPQPTHFAIFARYIIGFMLITIFYFFLEKANSLNLLNRRQINYLVNILILSVLMLALFWQVAFFNEKNDILSMDPRELEIYNWLNVNEHRISTILSDEIIINRHIALLTSNDLFLPEGDFNILKNDELLQRLIITHLVLNYTLREFENNIHNNLFQEAIKDHTVFLYELNLREDALPGFLDYYIFPMRLKRVDEGFFMKGYFKKVNPFDEREINKLLEEYSERFFSNNLKLPRFDYMITKRTEFNKDLFEKNNLLVEKVVSNDKYVLFKVTSKL